MPGPLALVAVPALIEAGAKIIERLFPDPEQQDKAKLELFKMQQSGQLAELAAATELARGQLEVNKAEAGAGPFRGGWRPAVGWVCAFGLAYQFVVRPLLTFALALRGQDIALPALELETLMTLLFGMLGLGGFRSYEKTKGLS